MPRTVEKLGENRTEANEKKADWPYISSIGDTLRATVVCRDEDSIYDTWKRLNQEFKVDKNGRLKNNFADANFKSVKKGSREVPPDILMNAVFVRLEPCRLSQKSRFIMCKS